MNISIHGVKKAMIEKVHKLPGRGSYTCTLNVVRPGR